MLKFSTVSACQNWVQHEQKSGMRVALVPTMGALHAGHLTLIRAAQAAADRVIVSIYVNPTQFGPNEDFKEYPRPIKKDLEQLAQLSVEAVFMPDHQTLYPEGIAHTMLIHPPTHLTQILCGISRPHFFKGVTTVVMKLLLATQVDMMVFGEKDFQQLTIIKAMLKTFHHPCEIISVPTVRASTGLALSSRNQYLDEKSLSLATELYGTLRSIAAAAQQNECIHALCKKHHQHLSKIGFKVDYLEALHQPDLQPLKSGDKHIIVLVAAWIKQTRLIDNFHFLLEK